MEKPRGVPLLRSHRRRAYVFGGLSDLLSRIINIDKTKIMIIAIRATSQYQATFFSKPNAKYTPAKVASKLVTNSMKRSPVFEFLMPYPLEVFF
jgi:hypothetical protein